MTGGNIDIVKKDLKDEISDEDLKNIFSYHQSLESELSPPESDEDFPTAKENFKPFIFFYTDEGKVQYNAQFKISITKNNNELKLRVAVQGFFNETGIDFVQHRKSILTILTTRLGEKDLNLVTSEDGLALECGLEQFSSNRFFQNHPLSRVYLFMKELESNSEKFMNFSTNIFEILANVEKHLTEYDKLSEVQICRKFTEETKAPKSHTALQANKLKLKNTGYATDDLPDNIQKHKRVAIPDSPFWVSIDVVTGESVIRVNETLMFYCDLPELFIKNLHSLLKAQKNFEILSRENVNEEDYSYLGNNSIYFCQLALQDMKEKCQTNSNPLIRGTFVFSSIFCGALAGVLFLHEHKRTVPALSALLSGVVIMISGILYESIICCKPSDRLIESHAENKGITIIATR